MFVTTPSDTPHTLYCKVKPGIGYGYNGNVDSYDESNNNPSQFVKNGNPLAFGYSHDSNGMNDTYEILAYAARARAKPLGTLPSISGFTHTNLTEFGYNKRHYSHSRQFRSNIVDEKQYWSRVKEIVE